MNNDPRLTPITQIMAELRREMLRSDDAAGQAAIWKVIKYYQSLIQSGQLYIPKF
jgi:hypothetical protein